MAALALQYVPDGNWVCVDAERPCHLTCVPRATHAACARLPMPPFQDRLCRQCTAARTARAGPLTPPVQDRPYRPCRTAHAAWPGGAGSQRRACRQCYIQLTRTSAFTLDPGLLIPGMLGSRSTHGRACMCQKRGRTLRVPGLAGGTGWFVGQTAEEGGTSHHSSVASSRPRFQLFAPGRRA
jgi:hypothetical protein